MLRWVGGRLVGSIQFVEERIVSSAGGDLQVAARSLVHQILDVIRIRCDRSAVVGYEIGSPDHRVNVDREVQRNSARLVAGLTPVCACRRGV